MDGFGPVEVEVDEPVFRHAWERTVFGVVEAMSGQRHTNGHAFHHPARTELNGETDLRPMDNAEV